MSSPSAKTIKQLFALSKNECAFPKCPVEIVLEENNTVVGEVCHIRGLRPNAARHDPTQTDDERNAFENLILMCSIHHKVIDEDDESYTVQRLLEIKKSHESRGASTLTDDQRRQFEDLLDERIRLIIEHEKAKASPSGAAELDSGPFALAKKMAERVQFQKKRATMRSSHEGLQEIIKSVNTIFSLIDQRYEEEKDSFSSLGIGVHRDAKHRVVATDEFGSQYVLEGFDGTNHYRVPDNLRMEMMLFGKRPLRQPETHGLFHANPISAMTFKPDFNASLNVIWIDDRKVVFTESQLVEKIFNDLLQKLEDERTLKESLPEGYHRRGGQYVDMFGNPLPEENEFDGW